MLPPQLDTGAEGSQRSRAAEPSVLDNKSKGRTLIKAPQADAAEGMGGVQLRLSWPGLLGKELCGRHRGEEQHPAHPEGQRGLHWMQPPRVLQGCGAVEVSPMEVPVLQENQHFVQPQPLGYGGNSQREHLQKSGWDAQHPYPQGSQGSVCARGCVTPGYGLGGFRS